MAKALMGPDRIEKQEAEHAQARADNMPFLGEIGENLGTGISILNSSLEILLIKNSVDFGNQ